MPDERQRRVVRDGPRERVGRRLDLRRGHHAVHHPDLEGAARRHGLAREQELARLRRPNHLEQLLQERERHEQADPRQRHREARRLGGDAEIAVQRELAPARVWRRR